MAKRRTFTRIQSFLSFKYFDRKSREYWQGRWKDRTGFTSARGWNNSQEFIRYRESIKDRLIKYAERNPEQFFEKLPYLLRYSKLTFDEAYKYGGTAGTVQAFLNPMRGKWGLSQLIEQLEVRAWAENKGIVLIARVTDTSESELLDEETEIVTSTKESDDLRGVILRNYGNNVAAGKAAGTYDLMGANYQVQVLSTSTDMLAVIDMELFTY